MATNREWAMKAIPVLVRWAQATWDKPHYYSDLKIAIGHNTNQLGRVLENVQMILSELHKKTKIYIPTLNGLVQNAKSGIPSDGFNFVDKKYSSLSSEKKEEKARDYNLEAHKYDWGWVLDALGLKPAKILDEKTIQKIKGETHGYGGEGKEHKALKEYIASHPEVIGIKNVKLTIVEHKLLSGDKLDVYFECQRKRNETLEKNHIAVEVKPASSPDDDVLRGIFQCVKYQVVMDAMRVVDNDNYENSVLLVLGGPISKENRLIANDLNIEYIDNVKIKKK